MAHLFAVHNAGDLEWKLLFHLGNCCLKGGPFRRSRRIAPLYDPLALAKVKGYETQRTMGSLSMAGTLNDAS